MNYYCSSLKDFFNHPAIPISDSISKTTITHFRDGTVEFIYNKHGYRTYQFDNISKHIVISGCSLTEGHGLNLNQTWHKKLEQLIGYNIINLAKGGSNAEFVSQNLINWITSNFINPELVIAQWPNPFRATHWSNNQARFITNHSADELYCAKAKAGDENFYLTWIKSIISLNDVCRFYNIPILNICFETPESVGPAPDILKQHNINLQLDLKLPGNTWHFDNNAFDKSHHSEWCNEQWANRVLTLAKSML
jgi:hypothetical protein